MLGLRASCDRGCSISQVPSCLIALGMFSALVWPGFRGMGRSSAIAMIYSIGLETNVA